MKTCLFLAALFSSSATRALSTSRANPRSNPSNHRTLTWNHNKRTTSRPSRSPPSRTTSSRRFQFSAKSSHFFIYIWQPSLFRAGGGSLLQKAIESKSKEKECEADEESLAEKHDGGATTGIDDSRPQREARSVGRDGEDAPIEVRGVKRSSTFL